MSHSETEIHNLVEQARSAFTNRQPELFHESFSQDCEDYITKEGGLDCSNCDLVVPFSSEMLAEAIDLFKEKYLS